MGLWDSVSNAVKSTLYGADLSGAAQAQKNADARYQQAQTSANRRNALGPDVGNLRQAGASESQIRQALPDYDARNADAVQALDAEAAARQLPVNFQDAAGITYHRNPDGSLKATKDAQGNPISQMTLKKNRKAYQVNVVTNKKTGEASYRDATTGEIFVRNKETQQFDLRVDKDGNQFNQAQLHGQTVQVVTGKNGQRYYVDPVSQERMQSSDGGKTYQRVQDSAPYIEGKIVNGKQRFQDANGFYKLVELPDRSTVKAYVDANGNILLRQPSLPDGESQTDFEKRVDGIVYALSHQLNTRAEDVRAYMQSHPDAVITPHNKTDKQALASALRMEANGSILSESTSKPVSNNILSQLKNQWTAGFYNQPEKANNTNPLMTGVALLGRYQSSVLSTIGLDPLVSKVGERTGGLSEDTAEDRIRQESFGSIAKVATAGFAGPILGKVFEAGGATIGAVAETGAGQAIGKVFTSVVSNPAVQKATQTILQHPLMQGLQSAAQTVINHPITQNAVREGTKDYQWAPAGVPGSKVLNTPVSQIGDRIVNHLGKPIPDDVATALNTLGLDKNATPEALRAARNKLIKQVHSDVAGSGSNNTRTQEIRDAYRTITDYLKEQTNPGTQTAAANPVGNQQTARQANQSPPSNGNPASLAPGRNNVSPEREAIPLDGSNPDTAEGRLAQQIRQSSSVSQPAGSRATATAYRSQNMTNGAFSGIPSRLKGRPRGSGKNQLSKIQPSDSGSSSTLTLNPPPVRPGSSSTPTTKPSLSAKPSQTPSSISSAKGPGSTNNSVPLLKSPPARPALIPAAALKPPGAIMQVTSVKTPAGKNLTFEILAFEHVIEAHTKFGNPMSVFEKSLFNVSSQQELLDLLKQAWDLRFTQNVKPEVNTEHNSINYTVDVGRIIGTKGSKSTSLITFALNKQGKITTAFPLINKSRIAQPDLTISTANRNPSLTNNVFNQGRTSLKKAGQRGRAANSMSQQSGKVGESRVFSATQPAVKQALDTLANGGNPNYTDPLFGNIQANGVGQPGVYNMQGAKTLKDIANRNAKGTATDGVATTHDINHNLLSGRHHDGIKTINNTIYNDSINGIVPSFDNLVMKNYSSDPKSIDINSFVNTLYTRQAKADPHKFAYVLTTMNDNATRLLSALTDEATKAKAVDQIVDGSRNLLELNQEYGFLSFRNYPAEIAPTIQKTVDTVWINIKKAYIKGDFNAAQQGIDELKNLQQREMAANIILKSQLKELIKDALTYHDLIAEEYVKKFGGTKADYYHKLGDKFNTRNPILDLSVPSKDAFNARRRTLFPNSTAMPNHSTPVKPPTPGKPNRPKPPNTNPGFDPDRMNDHDLATSSSAHADSPLPSASALQSRFGGNKPVTMPSQPTSPVVAMAGHMLKQLAESFPVPTGASAGTFSQASQFLGPIALGGKYVFSAARLVGFDPNAMKAMAKDWATSLLPGQNKTANAAVSTVSAAKPPTAFRTRLDPTDGPISTVFNQGPTGLGRSSRKMGKSQAIESSSLNPTAPQTVTLNTDRAKFLSGSGAKPERLAYHDAMHALFGHMTSQLGEDALGVCVDMYELTRTLGRVPSLEETVAFYDSRAPYVNSVRQTAETLFKPDELENVYLNGRTVLLQALYEWKGNLPKEESTAFLNMPALTYKTLAPENQTSINLK